MMSKTSAKRQVTEWVEPSFSDLRKNTKSSSSIPLKKSTTDTIDRWKIKEHFSQLGRGKSERKKGKPSSEDDQHQLSRQNLTQTEPWVDKYKPKAQNELAIHKKKIEEVEAWLKTRVFQRQAKQGGSVLLLTGPPGCGKSATVEILSKDLGIQVQEWINPILPDFKKDDFQDTLHHESEFQILPYQSQTALFEEFLLRANKYIKLQMVGESMETDKRLILVEDMPNHFYRDPSRLHEILRRFVRTGRCPLVFIISDGFSGASNQRSLFPKEIHEELFISNISFNPVAPTMMMKVLNRIAATEASMNGEKIDLPDKASLELICKGCSGDIRSAINSLQFSLKGELSTESDFSRLPAHLSEYERDPLLVQPEDVIEKSHMPGDIFNLYLHQNYVDFFSDIDDLMRASEYLSTADFLCSNWDARSTLREYGASVATRGIMHSNRARASAQNRGGMGFRPLHKPQWFLINKKYQENCIAAKFLFSSFCLPPLCLKTQLLPYLAMLTNPMRNQAQITFIQDVGRLPLKKHFRRMKLETLTDKDSAIQVLDSDDDDFAEMQPTNVFIQMEKNKTNEDNEPDEGPLPSSQSSGNELLGSQPQPIIARAIMEEDELNIEEYDSD
ncbi:cell cycle checkpoint protein RAD17 isoform X2 [Tiliqua scincoides]|uniref:cell cycle checkpoint protein RAD17 isoform X2 n=1 Tax=Tiliqua scincoides TaxID=71010 RepID=UPI003463368A